MAARPRTEEGQTGVGGSHPSFVILRKGTCPLLYQLVVTPLSSTGISEECIYLVSG